MAILKGKVTFQAEITSDGFPAYHGLVEAGFSRHHRIDKYAVPNHPLFVEKGVHINGIDCFRSSAKRRHQKFNGLRRDAFLAFLKETGFRFNNRTNDLYKTLLNFCRMAP
jgi:transposase